MKDLDPRVLIVLEVLAISPRLFYHASCGPRGFAHPRRDPSLERIRYKIAAGMRHLRIGGNRMSYPEIARALGITGHSTIIGRCRHAAMLKLLSDYEIKRLENGGELRREDYANGA